MDTSLQIANTLEQSLQASREVSTSGMTKGAALCRDGKDHVVDSVALQDTDRPNCRRRKVTGSRKHFLEIKSSKA